MLCIIDLLITGPIMMQHAAPTACMHAAWKLPRSVAMACTHLPRPHKCPHVHA